MVAAYQTRDELTKVLLDRESGETIIYHSTNGTSEYTIYHSASNATLPPRPMFPWERRLVELEAFIRTTIELFGRFSTGWIPSKGHQGLHVDHIPKDHNAHRPSPLDLRRIVRMITTVRSMRVP